MIVFNKVSKVPYSGKCSQGIYDFAVVIRIALVKVFVGLNIMEDRSTPQKWTPFSIV